MGKLYGARIDSVSTFPPTNDARNEEPGHVIYRVSGASSTNMREDTLPRRNGMTAATWLEDVLREAFAPRHLEVVDESAQHRGHAGAAGGGGHFRVLIVAAAFRGQPPVARQRAVYQALGDAMQARIHALALQTLTPEEWERSR